MKELVVYVLNGRVSLWFDWTEYRRPLSCLPRLGRLLGQMYFSKKYRFRPFLASSSFGIVAEKIE